MHLPLFWTGQDFQKKEKQVIEVEQVVITTKNSLPFHFSDHNNVLLVVKQWKGALNLPARSALRARSLSLRRPRRSPGEEMVGRGISTTAGSGEEIQKDKLSLFVIGYHPLKETNPNNVHLTFSEA